MSTANQPVNQQALDVLFNDGRSHNEWLDKPVEDALLVKLYDLIKMAPTSANTQPLRVTFVKSPEQKERLKPAVAVGNVQKMLQAPVCAILGMDMEFYNELPKLFPHTDAKSWFVGNTALIESTAFRNSSIQGGYFILAARALGLDTGAMSGFDNAMVDKLFFDGTAIKSNFLCNLGYGDHSKLHPRSPRPDFSDFCKIV